MALSVLCGQLLVVGLSGPSLGDDERRSLARAERGGVVLFKRNVEPGPDGLFRVSALAAEVQATMSTEAPALVAIDQEGGRVMRLGPPAMQLPPMRALGELDDLALITRVAEAQGRELSALGITMSFAPVADSHTRSDNPIIGDRAFGVTPSDVLARAGAFADGLCRAGVLTCAKHFPGHGDTELDSHVALPTVDRPLAELMEIELAPFAALARRPSVDSMMSAHVVYPALAPDVPATLSRAVCTELLRDKLGFQGVLFSDDLEMKAISGAIERAAVGAVLAGCDALLVCSRRELADEVHAALVHEAEASPAFRARCEEAYRRVARMRRRHVRPAAPAREGELARAFTESAAIVTELRARLGLEPLS